ncbi:hypothetical protein GCM10027176_76730 [Actinoallomurus bryophytorum]|uniref:PASTA domain-containing protein n=1 Tax=Actinoallomurus bryophytorum TaxID=1490222 RepID=A0A543C155_9ACTN|nr:hypothetical protein [Actinoallomurus bryophytorum]TQL90788.1 hypothetical protein FB559_8101 [Actinoallomurus bryophytorum]
MRTHPTDGAVRGLARVHDDALRGLARRPATRALFDDITTLPSHPSRARGRAGRRPMILGAVAAAAIAAAGVAGVIALTDHPDKGESVRLAAAVQIIRGTTYYEARIVDPRADRKRFKAAFAKYGLNIEVTLVPASPHAVGSIAGEDEDERAQRSEEEGAGIKMIDDPTCPTASGGNCSIGLRIPLTFKGHAGITIGREAEPGEPYVSTSPKDDPRGLEGLTVAQAEAALARKGLRVAMYNVYWPGWGTSRPRSWIPSRWKVSGADPYSPGTVLLAIDAQGPMPPDVVAEMRHDATASPTVTPTS